MLGWTTLSMVMLVGNVVSVIVIVRLLRSAAQMRWRAGHDELTGLMCRGAAHRFLAERHRAGRATTVVMLDLDRFKAVNDSYGHRAGDQLLAAVGSRLASHARVLGGGAARLGGDEFALMLPVTSQAEHIRQVEGILRDLSAPVDAVSHCGPVTLLPSATAGVATACLSDKNVLLRAADYALYQARLLGIRYACYQAEIGTGSDGHQALPAGDRWTDSRRRTASAWAVWRPV